MLAMANVRKTDRRLGEMRRDERRMCYSTTTAGSLLKPSGRRDCIASGRSSNPQPSSIYRACCANLPASTRQPQGDHRGQVVGRQMDYFPTMTCQREQKQLLGVKQAAGRERRLRPNVQGRDCAGLPCRDGIHRATQCPTPNTRQKRDGIARFRTAVSGPRRQRTTPESDRDVH